MPSLALQSWVKSLALHLRTWSCPSVAEKCAVTLLPVRPAPAAPKSDAMTAIPAVEPKAAAPALPMIVAAPAATRGAARPPVKPEDATSEITSLLSLTKTRQSFPWAVRVLLMLLKEYKMMVFLASPIKGLFETLPRPWISAQILWPLKIKNNLKVKGRMCGRRGWAMPYLLRKPWSSLTLFWI